MFPINYSQVLRRTALFAAGAIVFSLSAYSQQYTQTDLVTDTGAGGTKPDPNLVNAWGLSRSSTSPWWVANNGTGTSTLYKGDGTALSLVVTVPGSPTGTVFNSTKDFKLKSNSKPAAFLFASEDGTLSGWNGGTQAEITGSKENAVYKGLAIATVRDKNYLYATDFHNGTVDVYNGSFTLVKKGFDGDGDWDWDDFPRIAAAWRGFAPFGIQNIGGTIFVTFAKQDDAKHDDVPGPGNGFVAAFTPHGKLIRVFEHGWWLSSPWAVTLAPSDFGSFSHDLLVGQFGSGQIAAYNITSGRFEGLLLNTSNKPLAIDGLWGLGFGNGGTAGPANTLFFSAGPDHEGHGLFGTLTTTSADPSTGNGN